MKRNLLAVFFFTSWFVGFSQAQLVKQWDSRFGGNKEESLNAMITTMDGGYLLGGSTISDTSGDRTEPHRGGYMDYWVVKLDSLGLKQWDKRFGGTILDVLRDLVQTRDGGYLLGGWTNSDIGGDKTEDCRGMYDFWIVKIDATGHKLWDKTYGGDNSEYLNSIKQTNDDGFILGGYTFSDSTGDVTERSRNIGASLSDYWVVKIDSLGNKEWDKRFGGPDGDLLTSVQQTSDNGYILGGSTYSGMGGDKTQSSFGGDDYWIVKIDSLGNKQWDKSYGGSYIEELYSVIQTRDGGYCLGGSSGTGTNGGPCPFYYLIAKTDSIGNLIWEKSYKSLYGSDEFGNLVQTADGGFLLSGSSNSTIIGGDKTEANMGISQSWVIKTTPNGTKQWDKTIFTTGNFDSGNKGIPIGNGCYVFANYTEADTGGYKTQLSRGLSDYWIVKFCDTTIHCNSSVSISVSGNILTAYNGIYYQWYRNGIPLSNGTSNTYIATQGGNYTVMVTDGNDCKATSSPIVISDIESVFSSSHFTIFPNPATTQAQLLFTVNHDQSAEFTVTDSKGSLVSRRNIQFRAGKNLYNFRTADWASGVYLITIQNQELKWSSRLVKE